MKKGIIWDFDGTLVSRSNTWSNSILESLDSVVPGNGIKLEQLKHHPAKILPWHVPDQDHYFTRNGTDWWINAEKMIHDVVREFVSDLGKVDLIVKRTKANILDSSNYAVFSDVVPVLDSLQKAGWLHVILSNNHPDLSGIVRSLGLGPYIHKTFTSALIGYENPRSESYDFVRKNVGSLKCLWMVGDNESADAFGAEAAGISAILVRNEWSNFHRKSKDLYRALGIIQEQKF